MLNRPMVLYCRRKNASAPSWIASEILRMSGVPLSWRSTYPRSPQATARATTESPRTRMISMVCCGSLEPARGGLVSDSQGKGEDARHVRPIPRAGGVELVRQHALHELLAVRVVPNGRIHF